MPQRPERRASWLELFFDLVLVAAVASLSSQLHADHSIEGLAVFAGLFVPVWWAWWAYTWFSAGFDRDDRGHRIGILTAMVAVAAVASSIGAAARGDSDAFVLAYAAFFYVLTGLYVRAWRQVPAARALTARYASGDAAGATLWLASLALDESLRPVLWGVAMVVLMGSPLLAARSLSFLSYERSHIAERYGLFTLIVLGESVVVTVASLEIGSSIEAAVTAILGFVIAATIWWVYFDRWRSMPAGSIRSGWVWAQGHLLIFASIASAAVGVEFCVEAAAEGRSLELADRLPLGAGLASYLVAMAAIRSATRQVDWVVALRVGLATTILLISLVGARIAPVVLLAVCSGLLVAGAVLELRRAPPPERELLVLPHEIPQLRGEE